MCRVESLHAVKSMQFITIFLRMSRDRLGRAWHFIGVKQYCALFVLNPILVTAMEDFNPNFTDHGKEIISEMSY